MMEESTIQPKIPTNHDRQGGIILRNGHMNVQVETVLRGEGNQTSNLVVTMIATKRQMKPGSRQ